MLVNAIAPRFVDWGLTRWLFKHFPDCAGAQETEAAVGGRRRDLPPLIGPSMRRAGSNRKVLSCPLKTSTRVVIGRHRQFQEAPSGRRR